MTEGARQHYAWFEASKYWIVVFEASVSTSMAHMKSGTTRVFDVAKSTEPTKQMTPSSCSPEHSVSSIPEVSTMPDDKDTLGSLNGESDSSNEPPLKSSRGEGMHRVVDHVCINNRLHVVSTKESRGEVFYVSGSDISPW